MSATPIDDGKSTCAAPGCIPRAGLMEIRRRGFDVKRQDANPERRKSSPRWKRCGQATNARSTKPWGKCYGRQKAYTPPDTPRGTAPGNGARNLIVPSSRTICRELFHGWEPDTRRASTTREMPRLLAVTSATPTNGRTIRRCEVIAGLTREPRRSAGIRRCAGAGKNRSRGPHGMGHDGTTVTLTTASQRSNEMSYLPRARHHAATLLRPRPMTGELRRNRRCYRGMNPNGFDDHGASSI